MGVNKRQQPSPTQKPSGKRRGGAPVGNTNRESHGHWLRKRALMRGGFAKVDKRTRTGRALAERRHQIFEDLGGKESLSQIQLDLVERYMRLCVLIDSLDAWLFKQPSIVNKRRRALIPIVKERAQLDDSALRLAQALGLKRQPKPVPSLQEYLASKEDEQEESA